MTSISRTISSRIVLVRVYPLPRICHITPGHKANDMKPPFSLSKSIDNLAITHPAAVSRKDGNLGMILPRHVLPGFLKIDLIPTRLGKAHRHLHFAVFHSYSSRCALMSTQFHHPHVQSLSVFSAPIIFSPWVHKSPILSKVKLCN